MSASSTSVTLPASPTSGATGLSFVKSMNFSITRTALKQKHNIDFTDEDEAAFEAITRYHLKKHNGELIGTDFGASGTSLVYMLFAFIQNLWGGAAASGGLSGIGNVLSASASKTGQQNKLHEMNLATIGIYEDMVAKGGNLAAAAELVTGQTRGKVAPPIDMAESVFNQVGKTLTIDLSTPTSLNQNRPLTQEALAESSPSHGLPSQAAKPTKALTL